MNKQTKQIVIILVVLFLLYMIYRWSKRIDDSRPTSDYFTDNNIAGNITEARVSGALTGRCIKPDFKDLDLNGRECAGRVINENQILQLGDQSCEVLLLQQRLNAMQPDSYVLRPTGQFDCHTKYKLNLLMGVPAISLNRFSPDEQIGFNELEGGTKITPYSYMDVNNKII